MPIPSLSNAPMRLTRLLGALALVAGVFTVASLGVAATAASAASAGPSCAVSWAKPVSGNWTTAKDWTGGKVPGDVNVCITVAGTYTVTLSTSEDVASLTVGTTTGAETLVMTGSNGNTTTLSMDNGGSTNTGGVVVLEATKGNGSSDLSGGVFTNKGQLNTLPTGGGNRTISTDVVNHGTLDLTATSTTYDASTFNNVSGGITVGAGDNLTFSGTTVDEDNGTTSGPAPLIVGGSLTSTGDGASSFILQGSCTLGGSLAAGQTVTVEGGGGQSADASLKANYTNSGSLILTSTDASDNATLSGGGFSFTNDGTLSTEQGSGGIRYLESDIVNDGTITLNAVTNIFDEGNNVINASGSITVGAGDQLDLGGGTFTQEAGTVSGPAPSIEGTLDVTGTGAASFDLEGAPTLEGNTVAGQTLTVLSNAANANTELQVSGNVTNGGTMVFDDSNAATGSWTDVSGSGTLTNTGTISTVQDAGGVRYFEIDVVNEGTMTLDAVTNNFDEGNSIANTSGSLTVGAGDQLLTSGTFTQGAGTVSGPAPVIPATLDVTGTGAGSFVLVGSPTLEGNTAAGQTVTVLSNAANANTELQISGNVTNGGTLVFDNSDPTSGSWTDVTGSGVLTNTGTISTLQDAGGTRYFEVNVTNSGSMTLNAKTNSFDEGNTLINNGTLTLAAGSSLNSSGTVKLNASGTLALGISTSPAAFSTLTGGTVTLGGTLDVSTVGHPLAGKVYKVITATTSKKGTFASENFTGGTSYTVTYKATTVSLTAG
jgi:hypothetical protein